VSIVAYGYGISPGGAATVQTVEIGSVELEGGLVVSLNPARSLVELPADLSVSLGGTGLSVALGGGLSVTLSDDDLDVDLE